MRLPRYESEVDGAAMMALERETISMNRSSEQQQPLNHSLCYHVENATELWKGMGMAMTNGRKELQAQNGKGLWNGGTRTVIMVVFNYSDVFHVNCCFT